jgi:hypothetical protein
MFEVRGTVFVFSDSEITMSQVQQEPAAEEGWEIARSRNRISRSKKNKKQHKKKSSDHRSTQLTNNPVASAPTAPRIQGKSYSSALNDDSLLRPRIIKADINIGNINVLLNPLKG